MSTPMAPADLDSSGRPAGPPARLAVATDVLVVGLWFAVAGLLGALVWWQVTPLPTVVKTGDGATLAPEELVKQAGIDGWFFVVAAVGGLVSGVALLAWRRRDPLLMVVLVVLGGALAAWVMTRVGLTLGPERELTALRDLPEGAEVRMQLKLHAPGVAWTWPITAALGALVQLWVLRRPDREQPPELG